MDICRCDTIAFADGNVPQPDAEAFAVILLLTRFYREAKIRQKPPITGTQASIGRFAPHVIGTYPQIDEKLTSPLKSTVC
jgi:hypothetical protein